MLTGLLEAVHHREGIVLLLKCNKTGCFLLPDMYLVISIDDSVDVSISLQFYRPLDLRIALIGVEVWTTDQIVVDDNALATMKRFLTWRKANLLPRLHNDNAQLIM